MTSGSEAKTFVRIAHQTPNHQPPPPAWGTPGPNPGHRSAATRPPGRRGSGAPGVDGRCRLGAEDGGQGPEPRVEVLELKDLGRGGVGWGGKDGGGGMGGGRMGGKSTCSFRVLVL